MELFNAKISNFDSNLFVATVMKLFDTGGDLNSEWKINRSGIHCQSFIDLVTSYWINFRNSFEPTIENIEFAFNVRICRFKKPNKHIVFIDNPIWAPNVVFIFQKSQSNRPSTTEYARLTPELIMWVKLSIQFKFKQN